VTIVRGHRKRGKKKAKEPTLSVSFEADGTGGGGGKKEGGGWNDPAVEPPQKGKKKKKKKGGRTATPEKRGGGGGMDLLFVFPRGKEKDRVQKSN